MRDWGPGDTLVVKTEGGTWVAWCHASEWQCWNSQVPLAETTTRAEAEQAATAHRGEHREAAAEREASAHCPTCGQLKPSGPVL